MASRTLPGIGLKGFWILGEDGWKDENDTNLLLLSVLTQGSVQDVVAAEPGAPVQGDVVILDETHATHPNAVAAYDNGAWVYIAPREGLLLWNEAAAAYYTFNVADGWAALVTGGGSTPTPVQEWAPNFTAAGDVYIPADEAMTIDEGNAPIGTGTLAYEKSTAAAPGTFAATTLPATLEAGAWLKVTASAVTGFVAAHLKRTA